MDIRKVYYINLEKNKRRKINFEKNYYNNPIVNKKIIPLQRVSGVLVDKLPPNIKIRKGQYGCSLAHLKILKHISTKKKKGWYLICEDDCTGNFSIIPKKLNFVNYLPFINAVNLGGLIEVKEIFEKININIGSYNVPFPFGFGVNLHGYLVTPEGANKMYNIIKKTVLEVPCDVALINSVSMYFTSFHFRNILKQNKKLESDIQKYNLL